MTRFLALGDSYTIGEGVGNGERWPDHLLQLLARDGIIVDELRIIARTAWTTDELSDAIDAERPRGPFDLVSLMIGVNDQYRSRPVSSFTAEYESLLRRARSFAGHKASRVIAISIPDWGATPFARDRDRSLISREIEAYNVESRRLAEKLSIAWVDVTEASLAMADDESLVTADGLHPAGPMYLQWAKIIHPAALAVLSRRKIRSST